jgi:hypothetical protein
MNLNESVAKLHSLLPSLSARDAKFASDLIASYKKYNGLTPKQEPWIGRLIARATIPAFQVVASSPVVAGPVVSVGGFEGVIALFNAAKAHLKFPKITLVCNGQTIKLALLGAKSKHVGAVNITDGGKYPHAVWFGRVTPNGEWTQSSKTAPEFTAALTALLKEFSENPARVAKEHGKLTGLCCFCNKAVGYGEDKRSIAVGFGPDCAKNYGLKAEWLAGVAKAEAGITEVPTLTASIAAVDAAVAGAVTPAPVVEKLEEKLAVIDAAADAFFGGDTAAVVEAKAEKIAAAKTDNELLAAIIFGEPVKCFLCGEEAHETKELHGLKVCLDCVKQLV